MAAYKSQIRTSTLNALRDKVAKRNYGKYLVRANLANVRGLKEQAVTFDFPVTALIGPNGGGKTTILGAVATAYASVKPRQFFTKSGLLDESMANWRIEYELIDREISKNDAIRRTAAFHNSKWSRGAVNRETITLGVSRTVPASERRELQKCASGSFQVDAKLVDAIQVPVCEAVKRILGKDISQYSHIRVDGAGRVSLLTGNTGDGTRYSEFHFGAGESSIIRMVMQIEAVGENGLVLIEEIENGLHPVATVRLVEYLIDAAHRKSLQAIFTTHSNDALLPLPDQAIWASFNGKVFQGKLDIGSLRAITGQVDAALAIFCEDEFAAAWIRAMLRQRKDIAADAIEIHAMSGDGTAVKINQYHNENPAITVPSVCLIDGDSKQTTDEKRRVFRLPGDMPEAYVFDRVMDVVGVHGGRLTVRLQQAFGTVDDVTTRLQETRKPNHDAHVLYAQVAEHLGFLPVEVVQEAFFATWVEAYPDECEALLKTIAQWLPKEAAAKA